MPKVNGIKQPGLGTPQITVESSVGENCVYISQTRKFDGLLNPMTKQQALKLCELIKKEVEGLT